MNTAQIYAGRNSSATPIEPTAQTAPPAAKMPDKVGTTAYHRQQLADLLDDFVVENSLAGYAERLLDSVYCQLQNNAGIDPERDVKSTNRFTVRENHLNDLYGGLRLVYHVVAIGEQWKKVRAFEREGGSHE